MNSKKCKLQLEDMLFLVFIGAFGGAMFDLIIYRTPLWLPVVYLSLGLAIFLVPLHRNDG